MGARSGEVRPGRGRRSAGPAGARGPPQRSPPPRTSRSPRSPSRLPEIPSLYGGGLGRDVDVQLQHGRDVTSHAGRGAGPETILRPPGAALDDPTLRGLAADGIRDPRSSGPRPSTSPSSRSASPARRPRRSATARSTAIVPEPASDALLGSVVGEDPVRGRAGPARRARDDLAGAAGRDARRRAGLRRGRAAPRSVLPADRRGASRRRPGSRPPSRAGSSRRSRRPTRRSSRHRPSGGSPISLRRLAQAGEEADRHAPLDAPRQQPRTRPPRNDVAAGGGAAVPDLDRPRDWRSSTRLARACGRPWTTSRSRRSTR